MSRTNTSPSRERKNIKLKNYLKQQIGDIELVQIPARTVMPLRKTGLTKQTKTQGGDMTPGHVKAGTTKALRGTTDQRGLKALRQRFYILQLPLKTQKGKVGKGDKINPKWSHQSLNMVKLTALKRPTAEIIEKSRLVTDTA